MRYRGCQKEAAAWWLPQWSRGVVDRLPPEELEAHHGEGAA